MSDEILAGTATDGDTELDASLRPRRLSDFVGQPRLKEQLALVLEGARGRGGAVDHLLFSGPPGLGKTSLAGIVAAEMEADMRATSGPALERPGDLAAILSNVQPGDVLFIDEIHRLPRAVEEILYPAMEDFSLDIVVGKGPGARAIRLPLPPFTLVGATTRTGLITSPLRDRFGFAARLEFYEADDLAGILLRSAGILGVEVEPEGAWQIASRSRGTPRIANRLLKRVRDYAEVRADGVITVRVAGQALELFDIDHMGLDRLDRQVLGQLCRHFGGGPVGLSTLAVAVGEEADTIEDVVEPFLVQQGLLARTPRGRVATRMAFAHVGVTPPETPGDAAGTLFSGS
jgi:Holliday junction DNA helicase RuvB